MISNLYERRLLDQINHVPRHVTLVIAEKELNDADAYKKMGAFASWCNELGINHITVYISMLDLGDDVNQQLCTQIVDKITNYLSSESLEAVVYSPAGIQTTGGNTQPDMRISVGYGGKKELVDAIRSIATKVRDGELHSNEISEDTINSHLTFKEEPELVIRTGDNCLTDFLIWQAVYSELYFTEANWSSFRKMDLLRAIRDYQKRQKRHGL